MRFITWAMSFDHLSNLGRNHNYYALGLFKSDLESSRPIKSAGTVWSINCWRNSSLVFLLPLHGLFRYRPLANIAQATSGFKASVPSLFLIRYSPKFHHDFKTLALVAFRRP
jgi:hypothetical protein